MRKIAWKPTWSGLGLRITRRVAVVLVGLVMVASVAAAATVLMTMSTSGPQKQGNPFTSVCASPLTTTDAVIAGGTGWAVFTCGGSLAFTTSAGVANAKAVIAVNTTGANQPWTGITLIQSSDTPDLTKTSCALAFSADANKVSIGAVPSGPDTVSVNAGSYNYCVDYSASPSIVWVASITATWTK